MTRRTDVTGYVMGSVPILACEPLAYRIKPSPPTEPSFALLAGYNRWRRDMQQAQPNGGGGSREQRQLEGERQGMAKMWEFDAFIEEGDEDFASYVERFGHYCKVAGVQDEELKN
ncbi:hypothetical protein HPB48_021414 [Haemaphysalis longicornis]|uniref:Uncharacterized protein n=1 Tax=Haemaphysalis longicornis TaxID=44386 RepID=A0A9J6FY12_HAELO|nr:hypothetical protein HPB48_021414 [Haemaphysalis longicornis]